MEARELVVLDAAAVRSGLSLRAAREAVRDAMIALSDGRARQLLRSFIPVAEGRTFAIMPASLGERQVFGAKLVSVFVDGRGVKHHEGLVVLFDGEDGAPVCLADAGEVTAIRTPAASAAATDALARPDADVLAVLGTGRQARGHVAAIAQVRALKEVRVWGRDAIKAQRFAEEVAATGVPARALEARAAVEGAGIVCTTTAAADPVLRGAWLSPGAHVNLVGSSGPGQAEADADVVTRGRFIADHREHVLAHGGEFLRAGAGSVVAEIGEVFAGTAPGRTSPDEITVYKSLGHAVQDLAVTALLYDAVRARAAA